MIIIATALNQTVTVDGPGSITRNDVFIYPADREIPAIDIYRFIEAFQQGVLPKLKTKMDWYIGNHPILFEETRGGNRPDNRIVINLPYSNVDTFNGYFIGKSPQISLDKDIQNKALQDWNNTNSFQDRLAEISKQVDIYGRAFAFIYQNENSETRMTYADPESAFIIYDDTVEQNPMAFIRFAYDEDSKLHGTCYTANHIYDFGESAKPVAGSDHPNVYGVVPAVEFIANDERQGLNDQIFVIADAIDHAVSQKANNVEYFDNAYLKILGVRLPEDDDGNPTLNLDGNQVIYAENANAKDADISFIEKPDSDQMQENHINRLIDQNYNVTGVVNFNDQRITGNISGKALERLLQRMSNRAAFKRTKFTEALRELFKIVFSAKNIKGVDADAWQDLKFKFFENLPADYLDEATTLKTLEGVVSKETQFSTATFIDNPKKEIERMQDEQAEGIKNAVAASGTQTDQDKAQDDQEDQTKDKAKE